MMASKNKWTLETTNEYRCIAANRLIERIWDAFIAHHPEKCFIQLEGDYYIRPGPLAWDKSDLSPFEDERRELHYLLTQVRNLNCITKVRFM